MENIFNDAEWSFANLISSRRILIPLVQRAYVQGRAMAKEVREHFVDSLLKAAAGETDPLTLYFIYGTIDSDGSFVPLDGQQRLTTLLLVHWYFHLLPANMKGFSYDSRRMANEFVSWLMKCDVDLRGTRENPREWIVRQNGFVPAWESDESVAGMLTTLETIHGALRTLKYENRQFDLGRISFRVHYVGKNIDHGEAYLKINARGEALTPWENIKSIIDAKARIVDKDGEWLNNINGAWLGFIEQYLPTIPDDASALEEYIDESCRKLNAAFRNMVDLAFALCENESGFSIENFHNHKATYQCYRQAISKEVLAVAAELFSTLGNRNLCINSWTMDRDENCLWQDASKDMTCEQDFLEFLFDASENQSQFTYFRALRFALISHYNSSRKSDDLKARIAITRALNVLDFYSKDGIGRDKFLVYYKDLKRAIDDIEKFATYKKANKTSAREAEAHKAYLYCHDQDTGFLRIEADRRFGQFKGCVEFAYDPAAGKYNDTAAEFFQEKLGSITGPVQQDKSFRALMSCVTDCKRTIRLPQSSKPEEWTGFLFSESAKDAYDAWRRRSQNNVTERTGDFPDWIEAYFDVLDQERRSVLEIRRYPLCGKDRIFAYTSFTMRGRYNYNALIDIRRAAQGLLSRSRAVDRKYLYWYECVPYIQLKGENSWIRLTDILSLDDQTSEITEYSKNGDEYQKRGVVQLKSGVCPL